VFAFEASERGPASSRCAGPFASWRGGFANNQAACYRRACLSALAGVGFGAVAGSSFASAARNDPGAGRIGNLCVSMARRIAAVIAASSSSVRSIVGTASI
jgi:hypothetical protein